MTHVILCDGAVFRLERWGHGLAYALTHKPSDRLVFLQGDDAAKFDADLIATENAFPDNTTEQNAAWLWDQCDYRSAAS